MSVVLVVLAASLLGSVHCAAMCGGFVCFYGGTLPRGAARRAPLAPHAAYSAGRLAAYALLGALAGAAGGQLDRLAALAGIDRAAAIVAGALMVAWGAARLATQYGARLPRFGTTARLQSRLGRAMAAVGRWSPCWRAGAVGLLTALLPCGWLWAFVATAGGTGSAARGALVMAVFWAGTLPTMLALGMGVQRVSGPLQRRLPTISAAIVVLIGLLAIAGRLHPPRSASSSHAAHRDPHIAHGRP